MLLRTTLRKGVQPIDEVSKVFYKPGVPNTCPAYAKYADHLTLQRSQAVT